jgi:UPF0755 protein
MKRLLLVIAVLVLLAGATAMAGYIYTQRFLETPLSVAEHGELFEIRAGASFVEVCEQLAARGITDKPGLLRWYGRWTEQAQAVQAGEYLIKFGATPVTLLEQFTSGAVQLYSFTIVEGWNHRDLLVALQNQPEIEATMTQDQWPALLDEIGAEVASAEGLFLPETYHFPRGTSDRKLLGQAYALMQATLAEEWAERAENIAIDSPYDALILASIVEKETARADERQRIAGVFTRRIKKNMRLQTDPTVIYGLGPEFNGNLTRVNLQTDTPYNTYTRHGLPPTPIALPGRAAIRAALHPAPGDELFFVATGLGDGSHKFSTTVEEHQDAVQEYLKRLRQNRR